MAFVIRARVVDLYAMHIDHLNQPTPWHDPDPTHALLDNHPHAIKLQVALSLLRDTWIAAINSVGEWGDAQNKAFETLRTLVQTVLGAEYSITNEPPPPFYLEVRDPKTGRVIGHLTTHKLQYQGADHLTNIVNLGDHYTMISLLTSA